MAFVAFNVKQQNANSIADGVVDFPFNLTADNKIWGTCNYRVTANAANQQLFSIAQTSAIAANADGSYTIPDQQYPNNAKINIPAVQPFGGGNYNQLSNIKFAPSATAPGSGTLTGTFSVVGAADTTDDPFDWTATATTPVPLVAKKSGY